MKTGSVTDCPTSYTEMHQVGETAFCLAKTIRNSPLSTPGAVRLEIYNPLGQPMLTLVDQFQAAGSYQVPWDARDRRGATVAAGVYLVRRHYPGGVQTQRLLYLK